MELQTVKFKELRNNLNLTQIEIASKLGLRQQAWARFENGGVPDPRVSTIIKICKTFGVSADWLLGLTERDIMHESLKNLEAIYIDVPKEEKISVYKERK